MGHTLVVLLAGDVSVGHEGGLKGGATGNIKSKIYISSAPQAIKVGRGRLHLGCHLKCHPIETAACLCFAALRLFPPDLDPSSRAEGFQRNCPDGLSAQYVRT